MKNVILSIALLGAMANTACTNTPKSNAQPKDIITTKTPMKNLVSIIEIPVTDLKRAINFYSAILNVKIQEAEMADVKMGIFPTEEGMVNVVLANGPDYVPTTNGSVLYLNCGENLQSVLDKIEPNGGKVLLPKTEINAEMGFFALFIDTEGNKLGLHSSH